MPRLLLVLLPACTLCLLGESVCEEIALSRPGGDGDKLHTLISPGAGESRWMEIDWYPSVWEGRQVAAAAGKPLLLMAGSGGAPCAGC